MVIDRKNETTLDVYCAGQNAGIHGRYMVLDE